MGNFKSNNNNDNKNKIKNDYFSIIHKILLEKNRTNSTLINNVKVALNEKNFDQISNTQVQYFKCAPNQEPEGFIYWLDFLYDYLCQEHSIDRYWALRMKERLDEENFISENKYLSQFFLEEFEIENEPKCIQMIQIKSGRRKINVNNSILNVTQNLGGSFSNSSSKGEEIDDLATLKYKEFRKKVKRYILKFKEHILNKDHPINIVVQIFEKIWVEYVSSKIYSIKQKYKDYNNKDFIKKINIIVNEMTEQLQRFVVHLQICLKLFYARTINFSCFNEEKDELINLITTLVFRTGKISDTIFELYKLSLTPEIKNMKENFNKLIKVTPEELGISKQFCLNLETLDYQEKILMDYSKGNKIKNRDNKKINSSNIFNIDLSLKDQNLIDAHKDIDVLLSIIRDNKNRCPKFGDREIDETKVKLEYEENFNMIPREKTIKKKKIDTLLLPINEVSIDIENENENKSFQELNKYNIEDSNCNNESASNLNLYEDDDFNTNMIIRSVTNLNIKEEQSIIPTKVEKVFNKVSFVRTKNNEFLSYPYETAIQLLKQIQKYKTPFEKMMIIASISDEITDCINDFWKNLNIYIKNDLLNLEIDQLMIIFIYIIIKSQIDDISVHCKIIKSFTTCITKASMIGYYYSTVEASISYLQSIQNIKELLNNKSK